MNRPVVLSSLWIFVTLNYLYADVFSLMDPLLLPQWLRGEVEGITVTRRLLFAAAMMMEVPIAMTMLARLLPYRSNRRANVAAALFKTFAVAGSVVMARPNVHAGFFAIIEVAATVAIGVIAWRWRPMFGAPDDSRLQAVRKHS